MAGARCVLFIVWSGQRQAAVRPNTPVVAAAGRHVVEPQHLQVRACVSSTILAVVVLSLLSVITTTAGVGLAYVMREDARAIACGIGFSVGMMVLISMLELVPEALATLGAGPALWTAAIGAALVSAAHLLIPHRHLTLENTPADSRLSRSAYLVVLGLVLHDLPEGFAMANAYVASPGLGVLTALAIALHNLPEEFAMAVPAMAFRSRRFLFGAALASALAEPVGAVIGLAAAGMAPSLNARFLAVAAGAMLFVAVHELVPMARRYGHLGHFGAGMLASAIVYAILAQVIVGGIASSSP